MSELNPRSTKAPPEGWLVERLLSDIRVELTKDPRDAEALKELLGRLRTKSDPLFTFSMLAPWLFAPNDYISHSEALSLLTFLVSSDPSTYLKPASRAVRTTAETLSASPKDSMEVSDELLAVLVSQLRGEDVEVSANAAMALTACGRRLGPPLSRRALQAITAAWETAWDTANFTDDNKMASTVCVRCASSMVDLVCFGDAPMEEAMSLGALDLLMEMVATDSDPLLQMSALDLMEKLATTMPMHGKRAHWLFSKKVLHELLLMAGGQGEAPDPILGGPALRLLSRLCHLGQRDSSLFGLGGKDLLTGFHHALHGFEVHGELDRLAFVDAVSSFAGGSPDAMSIVLSDLDVRNGWLSLRVAQPKLKSVIVQSAANVIDPPKEVDASGDTLEQVVPTGEAAMRLYQTLGEVNNSDATELVMTLAKSPLAETRLGAYALLHAVSKRGTGAQLLLSHVGFFEFLMSREGETTKEGKEARYAIVETVMQSDAKNLLADSVVRDMDKYLKQGPYYVQTKQWELATDE